MIRQVVVDQGSAQDGAEEWLELSLKIPHCQPSKCTHLSKPILPYLLDDDDDDDDDDDCDDDDDDSCKLVQDALNTLSFSILLLDLLRIHFLRTASQSHWDCPSRQF